MEDAMPRMLKVQATRTFQSHNAGDVFLVEESSEIKSLVKARLFDVLAVELETTEPVPKNEPKKKKAKKNV